MEINTSIKFAEGKWQGFALAFRDVFVEIKLKDIDKIFNSENVFIKPEHHKREMDLQGVVLQRRARAHVYLERIDWFNLDLNLLSNLMRRLDFKLREENPEFATKIEQEFLFELQLLGFEVTENWELKSLENGKHTINIPPNASGITKELERINRGLSSFTDDPHAIVGFTKNLIEATAKMVIFEFEEQFDRNANVDVLIKRARELLEIHSKDRIIPIYEKKLLANVGQLAISINEFRNSVKGSGGHGSFEFDASLNLPTARLLVDSGVAWVRYVLAVLEVRKNSKFV